MTETSFSHTLYSKGENSQRVTRQVREAESEAELVTQAVATARGMMERVESAWETYNKRLTSLQAWLPQRTPLQAQCPAVDIQVILAFLCLMLSVNSLKNNI